MNNETRFVTDHEKFAWCSWAGDMIVFDRVSGESWMMERPAGHILKALRNEEALTLREIRDLALGDFAELMQPASKLDEVIATLIELGILIRFENTRPVG